MDTTEMKVGLNANWLDSTSATSNTVSGDCASSIITCAPYWYSWPYYGVSRPIKLGMSEVEYLRGMAKKNKKLRAILGKFTESIEIIVDFD
jgi:hypothetical protein